MSFADEFIADLKAAGVCEEPDLEVIESLLDRYGPHPGPGYPRDLSRDDLILRLAYPVYKLTLRYRKRNNAYDILSEALLALVECVDRWPSVAKDQNIWGYVEFTIKKRIKDFIDHDSIFVTPRRRVREMVAAGEEFEEAEVFPLDPHDENECESPTTPPDESYDVCEFFESHDERHQVILAMRSQGRPVEEIAEAIGSSVSFVWKSLNRMEDAYHGRSAGDDAVPPDEQDARIVELIHEGLPAKQVAHELGITTSYVHRRLKVINRRDPCIAC